MADYEKVIRLIGLAKRAGKVRAGTFITEKLLRENKALFVVIAKDGSPGQKEKLINLCKSSKAEYIVISDKEKLGNIIGKEEILSVVITDINFVNGIKKEINK